MPRGILFPFERTLLGDFANGDGAELAVSKVIQVLGTQPGELDWNPSFGCNLRGLRHKNNTLMLEAMAEVKIRDAFELWLPSLVLTSAPSFVLEGRHLRIGVLFNERMSSPTPRFPKDLKAEVNVTIAG